MRNGHLLLLSALGSLGLLACSGKRLHAGDDGAGGTGTGGTGGGLAGMGGGRGGGGGQAGTVGAAGSIAPGGAAGTTGAAGTGGSTGAAGAAAGQSGSGGTGIGNGLSVDPSAATFGATLVEAVSAPQIFTVRNDGNVATAVAALEGTNAADFSITSNSCGAALQPGASCAITVAFGPKTRSGARSARLTVGAASGAPVSVSVSGTALPSLGLLAGRLGAPGFVDGTGDAARLGGPLAIAGDGAGNFYVTDEHTIRKLVVATGAVTTIAGAPGQSGATDGTGTAARFTTPFAIAGDGAGNLYVVDGSAIRKFVVATGAVTTIAGVVGQGGQADGTGAAARFNVPSGIASDGAGNLYVSDTGNGTIRRVVAATGTVTTIAGSATQYGSADGTGAAARFSAPYGIASDGAGNLYVADLNNGNVRKIVLATRAVTTLPGTFEAACAVAVDGAGNLFVTASGSVRKIVLATGADTLLAGAVGQFGNTDGTGAAARFGFPLFVTSDGAGNLIVGDFNNGMIRKLVVATGDVTTLAGASGAGSADGTGSAARFSVPRGIASDGAGRLYVADLGNSTIRQIVVGTRAVTTLAGTAGLSGGGDGTGAAASFDYPANVACDGAGNVYVSESSSGSVRQIVIATRAVTTFGGVAGVPSGIVSDGAGNLYVGDSYWNTIQKVVVATGAVTRLAGATGFSDVEGITGDGAGNLYVADHFNYTIRKVVIATGTVTTLAGTARLSGSVDGTGADARFNNPIGIASDGAGNLYVTDGNTIRKVAIASATVSTVVGASDRVGVTLGALPASLNAVAGVAVLPTGELAIVDGTENAVLIGHL